MGFSVIKPGMSQQTRARWALCARMPETSSWCGLAVRLDIRVQWDRIENSNTSLYIYEPFAVREGVRATQRRGG